MANCNRASESATREPASGCTLASVLFGPAVGTVRRAIDVLAREGLVRTVPGRGMFVADRPR
jgi:hypothetical protein